MAGESKTKKRIGISKMKMMKMMKRKRMPKKRSIMSPDLHSTFKLGVLLGQDMAANGSNFVFSPLSLRAALGLLAGLLGKEDQGSVLSFLSTSTLKKLNATSGRVIHTCRPSNDEAVLKISLANGIWASHAQCFTPSFLETAQSLYKSFIKQVDFNTKHLQIRNEINDWIKKETGGLIKNFLPERTPNHATDYVLANALYFKGNWKNGFDSSKTKNENFYLLEGSTVKVPMMAKYGYELYSSFEGFKALVLPFKKDHKKERRLSMIMFLPDKKEGLTDLITKLASDTSFFDAHIPKSKESVIIRIPKFKISSKIDAGNSLKKMGLDIGRMSTFHGATIEVDEKGTVAAASTGSVFYMLAISVPPPPKEFFADHPFIYAIREDTSGSILFYGHVANPLMD